jgi:protein involved in polysaccharide export with SLBB domain
MNRSNIPGQLRWLGYNLNHLDQMTTSSFRSFRFLVKARQFFLLILLSLICLSLICSFELNADDQLQSDSPFGAGTIQTSALMGNSYGNQPNLDPQRNLQFQRPRNQDLLNGQNLNDQNMLMAPRPTKPPELPLPNLFQAFIQRTTGKLLPMYGHDLFTRPNSFSETQSAPVSSDYSVGPGDEILLKIYGGTADINQRMIVDREGMIALPKVGPVSVVGIKVGDLEKYLKGKISKVLSNFNLFVSIGQLRGLEVYTVGHAQKPGKYTVSGMSTLISALFATGGSSNSGSLRQIQLMREGKLITTLDLYEFLAKGDTSKDQRLQSGDVINIPPIGPLVAIKGAIPVPAIYELKGTSNASTLKDLISLVGGTPSETSPYQVSLERMDSNKEKPLSVQTIGMNAEGLKTELKDGDVLTFFPIKPNYDNAATLRLPGEDPIRVPVGSSTRVKDILPSREALQTQQHFLRRFGFICAPDLPEKGSSQNFGNLDNPTLPQPPQVKDQTVVTSSNGVTRSTINGATKIWSNAPVTGLNCYPADLENPTLTGQDTHGIGSIGNDIARIRRNNNEDQINWDNAILERPNPVELTTQIIAFNLGKAIAGDEQSNLQIQPGDTITVFSEKDVLIPVERQTQIVRIQGEVNAPGVYQITPGEDVKSLITRAGGLTSNAYVYGTVLSRQSVKKQQRENLEVVINRLESQLSVQSSKAIASATESNEIAQATALTEQQNRNFQAQIKRLQAMSPNGRIALQIDPKDPKYPAFRLEDGDEILVPSPPGIVSTVGAVYNENVLMYQEGQRVSDYLEMAGLAENAETDQIFVLRADGSLVPPGAKREKVYLKTGLRSSFNSA